MCVTDHENADIWVEFLEAVLRVSGLEASSCTFVIDKSTTEMAAVERIGARFILCIFHLLQEAERFLKSGESGVSGVTNKSVT